jgi:ribosomal protein L11 methyltransferase
MSLFQIKEELAPSEVERIDELLLELGVEGWSLLQDVIQDRAWVVGIFGDADEAMLRWAQLAPHLGREDAAAVEALPDTDWKDSYKAHFKAWTFGRLHWVPVWEREAYALPSGDAVIWLDPGLAFGTGNHETTRLCVERLVALAAKGLGGPVVDAGCGSGILALSAAKLGFSDVSGFDNDAEAVRIAVENAELNGAADEVRLFTGDLVSGLAGVQARVLLANIQADVLRRFSAQLLGAVAPGGTLVLSGILAQERDAVRAHFEAAAPGWPCDSRVMGEWSDVVLSRP